MNSDAEDKSSRPSKEAESSPRLESLGRRLDQEVEDLIRWFNDDVVPAARSQSSKALRSAADKLAQFADHLDEVKREK